MINRISELVTLFIQGVFDFLKRNKVKSFVVFALAMWYYFALPKHLFSDPYSVVLESKEGYLLGAKIAADGQWRFPQTDSVPHKISTCLIAFEDRYFYHHPGINPVSIWNAIWVNISERRVVRGGSTLTQQVIRLARKGQKRTYFEKIIEIIWATRLELRNSKEEILRLYASHAPFGGNVVGLEMASWRYFGIQPHKLSWAEAATLAVLPNAPSLIYPGKNQLRLLQKRNKLLHYLFKSGEIDELTYQLAISEPLPMKPFPLPQTAPHLVERIAKEHVTHRYRSTINFALQERANQLVQNYHHNYAQNEVHNMAVIVVDVRTRNVLVYVANSPTDLNHGKDVDIILAPRSTGSILKPILYAEMLNSGMLLPSMLVPDIPTQISGYTPQNYNSTYDGAVPAWKALARSLNIPAVLLLQRYGVANFYEDLKFYRQNYINKHPNHYGLSLILGGAESSLWDLCKIYASYASTLNHYNDNQLRYRRDEFKDLNLEANYVHNFGTVSLSPTKIDASSIFLTFQAMQEVNRVTEDEAWRYYSSANRVAWKTGTSFGNRDAWAIGINSDYVVGVWVGNASGEGRPEMTGVSYASPIMFDIFNTLPKGSWFKRPEQGMTYTDVCSKSGYLAGPYCDKSPSWINKRGEENDVCPYHLSIQLDQTLTYRVHANCESTENRIQQSWFALPPVMEYYYKRKNIDYQPLPAFRVDCESDIDRKQLEFIYPKNNAIVYLTKDFNGTTQPLVMKVANSQTRNEVFWYMNNVYLGSTKDFHEMTISPKSGNYIIHVIDQFGNEDRISLDVFGVD